MAFNESLNTNNRGEQDIEWIATLQSADATKEAKSQALADLIARHYKGVLKFIYSRTGSLENSEDIAQNTFLKVLENIHRYKEGYGSFTRWLYTIAYNASVDFFRRNNNQRTISIEAVSRSYNPHEFAGIPAPEPTPEEQVTERIAAREKIEAMEKLPHQGGRFLLLVALDLNSEEIAGITGLTPGAVMSKVYRTRRIVENDKDLRELYDAQIL
jgi:RNA polymerase sigma-70 factor (ECF subfamily)